MYHTMIHTSKWLKVPLLKNWRSQTFNFLYSKCISVNYKKKETNQTWQENITFQWSSIVKVNSYRTWQYSVKYKGCKKGEYKKFLELKFLNEIFCAHHAIKFFVCPSKCMCSWSNLDINILVYLWRKKILNADYSIPDFVSDDCRDLIKGILNTDPQKRFTV